MIIKNKKLLFIILLLLLQSVGSLSADSGFYRFMDIAFKNRKEIQIAKEQVKLAKLRVLTAARTLGPDVYFEYKETKGETITDPYQSKSYGLKADQSIFMGGQKFYTLKKELRGLEVAKNEHRRAERNIRFEAARAYYQAVANKVKLRHYEGLIEETEKEFKMVEKKFKAKLITQIQYMEVKSLKDEIILQKEIAEDEFSFSVLELKQKCGLDLVQNIYLTAENLNDKVVDINYTLEECKELALSNRPEVKAIKALVSQTDYDEKAAKAERWPNLFVEGYLGRGGQIYLEDFEGDFPFTSEWYIMAVARWAFWGNSVGYSNTRKKTAPSEVLDISASIKSEEHSLKLSLFDRLDYFYAKKEKKIARLQAEKDFEETKRTVVMETEKSYNNFKSAIKLIQLSRKKLEVSEKNANVTEKKKLLGQATSRDVLRARMEHTYQKNSLQEAIQKYNVAKEAVNTSCGVDIFQE